MLIFQAVQRLAIFDFDGTITTSDSLLSYMKWTCKGSALWGNVLKSVPHFLGFKLGLVSRTKAKEQIFGIFFGGLQKEEMTAFATRVTRERFPGIMRAKALETIRQHKKRGHRVVLLTAAPDLLVLPWCEQEGIDCIATIVDVRDGMLTGRFASENCYGLEKVRRLRAEIDLDQFDYIYAYGDSRGDQPFMHLAHERHYRPFRN